MTSRLRRWNALLPLLLILASLRLWSQEPPKLTSEEEAKFLKTAKVVTSKGFDKGITNTVRMTLSDGTLTHDAQMQAIDVKQAVFQSAQGTELNFRDSYKFNIAAYRLGVLLGIGDRIPMSIERSAIGKMGAVTWWIDNVMFDEEERLKRKATAPDLDYWNQQMYVVRVFDQLIYNTDRNLGNLLIDKNWKIWMIDHTRAFRLQKSLHNVKNLVLCERSLFEKMKALDKPTLMKELRPYVDTLQIDGLLARRDLIVKFFEDEAKQKGDSEVFYTLVLK